MMIRVDDEVSDELLSAFPHLVSSVSHVQTTLTGTVVDQEELQGVINYLASMGVTIVDVLTIPE
ncbi:hypothetical protein [Nocardioides alpinus]|uniref:hypothetical protein n=1 Tax=Nocardioides alpinus TaxID=748909 RepID=UPI001113AB35|nr:hypothetical protein [Nocardioides alpinus]